MQRQMQNLWLVKEVAYRGFWTEAELVKIHHPQSIIPRRYGAAPKSSSRAKERRGGAQLAQDCLDLAPVADAAADHLHAGAI